MSSTQRLVRFAAWRRLAALLTSLLPVLLFGCSSPAQPAPGQFGSGELGDACKQTEDCASGVCVRVDASGGICSLLCVDDSTCPRADNWGCLSASNAALRVCACRRLAENELCGDGLDNDCDGKVDDCRSCDGVAVAVDDPRHCGACGNACRADQLCRDQACACAEPLKDCAGQCVDTSYSTAHCGACGRACAADQVCTDGVCHCPSSDETLCPAGGCVDLERDPNNCGGCGIGCSLGRECRAGECRCPSVDAPDFCDGTGCVALQSDAQNCGKCGAVCAAGLICSEGECVCPDGKKSCDGACVDTQADEANCGECGQSCGAQQTCIQGSCGCDAGGYSICGGDCVDLQTDTAHCGDCDQTCVSGERCMGGSCSCVSQLYCDDVCMDAADSQNCGACGHACGAGQRCSGGSCVCQGLGLSVCQGGCVDVASDESNCGGCGISCRQGEQCYSGICECPFGQTYCAAAGTCVSLGSDPKHCGACGNACDPTEICDAGLCTCAASGALYCASETACTDTLSNTKHCGACDKACKPTEQCRSGSCGCGVFGQVYCASTNACTDTLSNTKHCGSCDSACRATEICSSGHCYCPGTQQYCAGAKSCVELSTDSKNCGACGQQCAAAQHCASSACVCDQVGLTACGSSCYDLQADEAHCGACDVACGAAFSCIAGSCKCEAPTPGAEVRLMTDANDNYQVSAAWDGTNVGVAYVVGDASLGLGYNLYFARLKPDGTLVGTLKVTSFSASVTGVYEHPQLIWNGSEYAVLWVQNVDVAGMPVIMMRRIKPSGAFAAAAVTIASSEVVNEGGFFYTYRVFNAGLAWSAPYGGYATTYSREGNTGLTLFRRLGADGTAAELPNSFAELSRQAPTFMQAAPDGTWGILGGTSLQLINADGSKTTTPSTLDFDSAASFGLPLLHDGQTFVTAGRRRVGSTSNYGIYLNRGTAMNNPALLFQAPSGTLSYGETLLTKAGESIVVGYARSTPGSSFARLAFQRYAIPATLTSSVQALHDSIDVMSADTMTSRGGDAALVATGPGKLLAIWADTRWGKKQLYARPFDLHACP